MLYLEFQQIAARFPDKEAVVVGEERLSYSQLDATISAIAQQLLSSGVGKGDAVILLLQNNATFVAGVLATIAIGAVAVPINPLFPAEEIRYYLETSQANLIIHEDALADLLHELSPTTALLSRSAAAQLTAAAAARSSAVLGQEAPALYMYSSGSTGKPKRVTRTHGQLVAERQALAATLQLGTDDRILCTVPLFHSHGFGNCMMAALLNGGTLVISVGEFNSRDAVRLIERERITVYPSVPFMLKMMAETFFKTAPDLTALRMVFSAGAALPKAVFEAFKAKFGVSIRQLYGSTETGAIAINTDGGEGTEDSVGRPLVGYQIDVLDDAGNTLPDGQAGLIAVYSPAQTAQYDGLPEITAECFVGNYFLPGDIGVRDHNGFIFIQGRKKLLINVAGYKVDPVDVETVIGSYPKVKDVVVLGVDEDNAGEAVKAVVVANDACTPAEIIQHCAKQLAAYKVPKIVEFRDEIPRSPLGKILRKYL